MSLLPSTCRIGRQVNISVAPVVVLRTYRALHLLDPAVLHDRKLG